MTEALAALQRADFAVLDFIQTHTRCAFLDTVMPYITHLGSAGIAWIIITAALLCVKKYRRAGVTSAIALILCFIVCNLIIKNIAARLRPFDVRDFTGLLIAAPEDFSFPSGHTASSVAAAMSLMLCKMKRLGTAALILAALIAFSRLYLYVHFPSDVLAGIILGAAAAFAARALTNRLWRGKKQGENR